MRDSAPPNRRAIRGTSHSPHRQKDCVRPGCATGNSTTGSIGSTVSTTGRSTTDPTHPPEDRAWERAVPSKADCSTAFVSATLLAAPITDDATPFGPELGHARRGLSPTWRQLLQ